MLAYYYLVHGLLAFFWRSSGVSVYLRGYIGTNVCYSSIYLRYNVILMSRILSPPVLVPRPIHSMAN